jgi:sulfoquinovose isomerase
MDTTWQENQRKNLVTFGRKGFAESLGGYGHLQAEGVVKTEAGLATWVNCRATYCFALDVLAGNQDSYADAEAGGRALLEKLWDSEHGGWFTGVTPEGVPFDNGDKVAYAHAFVLLAASSLTAIKSPLGAELLAKIDSVLTDHFWSEDERATVESWDRSWSTPEAYRGANSNMHMTEASLAAYDVTGDMKWLHRAEDMAKRIIGTYAKDLEWRIPEHFDADWTPDLGYNSDDINHPFRPFGSTPGHGFEWARLVLQLAHALENSGESVASWHHDAAVGLFNRALEDGWSRNNTDGFVYTVDFDGAVVNSLHLGWVVCEALSASVVLEKITGDATYTNWNEKLWVYCDNYLVDQEHGGWRSELNEKNEPSAVIWGDKSDFYHTLQTVLIPRAKLGPSLLGAL